ncbi:XRE family transcriptional regulator [uncultured Acetatifactor sp.]|jgi:predicted transcriptional regulator|uniref:XRE family transcriptional regulator n=1 Tax=uncultured Acetatifactor sp. TaxID=1671927 RepID=UPI0025EA3036|nr:XRE family transcriptional regulator [uncultured Acetatifactor sp.]
MTDVKALKKCIEDSGMTVVAIAEKSGILRETLYNRLKTGDFKLSEICALSTVLRLDRDDRDRIFFATNSE